MPDGLARLVDVLSPAATPVSLQRLKGGIGTIMHVLRYEMPSGERRNVVLRRYITKWPDSTAERARYEFGVLALLDKAGIVASKPLLLDADGTYFGGPSMVLSYVPGRSFFYHPDEAAWVEGLAQGLAQVHTVTPQRFDLSWLRPDTTFAERAGDDLALLHAAGPFAAEAHYRLLPHYDTMLPAEPCLVHHDYWPGNTVWFRGRLAAVIDWTNAGIGDFRADVSQCRADLVFSNGLMTADAFLRSYEAAALRPVSDLWFYDAFMGLRALLNYPKWLEGYHDAGMRHLELADVGARLEAFVRRALDAAP